MYTDVRMEPFDYQYLLEHPVLLQSVCNVYCEVWETDEHFGEYRKCPTCGQYFSFEMVDQNGLIQCPNCSVKLEPVWLPVSVAINLLDSSKHYSFAGVLLLNDQDVIGFSWGRLYPSKEMNARWGDTYSQLQGLNPTQSYCFHLAELGVVRDYRGKGWGTKLVRQVLLNPFGRYPDVLGSLATHQDSTAVGMYERLGYTKVADNPEGQGRIRMGIARIGNLKLLK